jgi:uncharacterized C2H2 Zn-finger protein
MPINCHNCWRVFTDTEAYQRHQWNAHAGEVDRGEFYGERVRLRTLKPAHEYPEPPRLDA